MAKRKAEAKETPIHEREVKTGELAAIVGKSDRWIRMLVKDDVLTQVARGKFVLGDAIQAYIEHAEGGKDDGRPRLVDERTEHERLKKEKAALELQRLRGELHATKDVEQLVSDMIVTTKAKLQAIPTKLAPKLDKEPAAVVEREMRREINAAMDQLSKWEPANAEKDG